jgi:hypothetical protein
VDSTLEARDEALFLDPPLVTALQEAYGRVEVFHSRPPKYSSALQKKLGHPIDPIVMGALPMGAELSEMITYAWNVDRSVPKVSGVIHPLGVTYYTPTRALLTAGMGPAIRDEEWLRTERVTDLPRDKAIRHLIAVETKLHKIEKFDGSPEPTGFEMEYFPLNRLDEIDRWLNTFPVSLTPRESREIEKKQGR